MYAGYVFPILVRRLPTVSFHAAFFLSSDGSLSSILSIFAAFHSNSAWNVNVFCIIIFCSCVRFSQHMMQRIQRLLTPASQHQRMDSEEQKTHLISTSVPVLRLFSMSEMMAFRIPKIVSVPRVNSEQTRTNDSMAAKTLGMTEFAAESKNFSAKERTTGKIVSLYQKRRKNKIILKVAPGQEKECVSYRRRGTSCFMSSTRI